MPQIEILCCKRWLSIMNIEETRLKIEILTNRYKVYLCVYFIPIAIFSCLIVSEYVLNIFSQDSFSYANGDRPLEFSQVIYNDTEVTTVVATWIDKEGNVHYAKDPATLFGFSVPTIVLLLANFGVIKLICDIHSFFTYRYRKRLLAENFPAYIITNLNL